MDSLQPMLSPPVPINAHCDTKGGYDTYPGTRYAVTRLAGMNGFTGGRTRTVSSGYTSDRDLDDGMHVSVFFGDFHFLTVSQKPYSSQQFC